MWCAVDDEAFAGSNFSRLRDCASALSLFFSFSTVHTFDFARETCMDALH